MMTSNGECKYIGNTKNCKTAIRPVLTYGTETWAIRKNKERILEQTEMRMLRWTAGISLIERSFKEDGCFMHN